jgi:halocyanin-like protein
MDRRDFLRTAGGVAGGTAAASAAGTAAAQEGGGGGGTQRPVFPSYVDGAKGGSYQDLRGQSSVTVEVGAGSSGLAFSPTKIWIDPGTEVTFEWVSNGHNVLPESQPSGAGWEGSGAALEDSGFTYSFTFETGGMYTYYCQPHESLGMKGAIAVGPDVETETVGGGGSTPVDPEHMGVPFHPHYVGVATIVMMVVSLLFTFFLLKYGESPHASGGNN